MHPQQTASVSQIARSATNRSASKSDAKRKGNYEKAHKQWGSTRRTGRALGRRLDTAGGLPCCLASLGAAAFGKFSVLDAFAESQPYHHEHPWYPLHVPDETPPGTPFLTCAPAQVNMGDGRLRGVWAYNGRFPGPTWVARTGDVVTTRLENGLSESTITHWHGLIVNYQNDGGPRLSIGPGQFYD